MQRLRIFLSIAPLLFSGVANTADGLPPTQDCHLGGALAGMVVHIDPQTGRPTSRPMPEQARDIAALQAARANRSTVGLVEERGPTGGVRVNLRNRFRSPLVGVVAADGVTVDHLSCTPLPRKAGGEP